MKLKVFLHVPRDKYKFNLEEGEQCVWRRIIGSIPTAHGLQNSQILLEKSKVGTG
jgi:hypothetical protein